jgi:cytochrome oxidase Cu insertion factor (SCO1/SenC/PrrC family)
MRMTRSWMLALAAGVLAAGVGGAQEAQKPEIPKAGDTAPNFTLKTPEGKSVTLSDLTKKNIVLVNFFFNG